MRDVTLVIFNSLRIKCHIRRPLKGAVVTNLFLYADFRTVLCFSVCLPRS